MKGRTPFLCPSPRRRPSLSPPCSSRPHVWFQDGKSESQQPATRNPKQKRKRSEGREAPEGCTAIGHPAKDGKANKGGGSSAVREAARQLLEAFAPLTGREEAEEPQPQKYKGAGGSELVVELQGLRKQKTNKKPEQGGDREAEELESHRKQKMQTSHGGGRGQEAEEPQAAWKPKNIGVGGVEKALGLPPSKKQKSMEGREQKEADQAEIKAMHGIAGKKGEKARERKNSKREHKPEAVDLVGGVRASGEGQRGAEHGEAGGGSKAHKRRKARGPLPCRTSQTPPSAPRH